MLSIAAHKMPAGLIARRHGHAAPHLAIVLRGAFIEQTRDQRIHDLGAGAVRMSQSGVGHHLQFGADGATCLMLEAGGPFWRRVFSRALNGNDNVFRNIGAESIDALAQVKSVEQLVQTRSGLLAFGRLLSSIEGNESNRAPQWLDDALDALESGAERPIAAIARTLQRDRVHFARSFAAYVGLRPSEYRAVRRAGAAVAALRLPGASLPDVAFGSGYADQSHMSNDFRALLGGSPSRFKAIGA